MAAAGVQKRQTTRQKEDTHAWEGLVESRQLSILSLWCMLWVMCRVALQEKKQLTAKVKVRRPLVSIRKRVGMVATT